MRLALLQMTAGIDPDDNAAIIEAAIGSAHAAGADMLFTPEMSNLLDRDKVRAAPHITFEDQDRVLGRTRAAAASYGLWVQLGSIAVRHELAPDRLANRSILINSTGDIQARYDKMHLFDVDLPTGESWRESNSYQGGNRAVIGDTPWARIGHSICYDIRFPALYQALSQAGATMLTIPAAFTVPTGRAHWQILLQARAIENACFVVAAAQSGHHPDGRDTWGHSMVIGPWGDVLLDMGDQQGIGIVDIDLDEMSAVRGRIPVLAHRRNIPAIMGPAT